MATRTALVIGNASYPSGSELDNPVHDAQDVAERLERFGFMVTLLTDATVVEMDRAVKKFKQALANSDTGLVFFAGHGIQIDDENFLIAVDTDASDESSAKHSSMPLNRVIDVMGRSSTQTNIIILDACRNNPFRQRWIRSLAARGLAPVYVPRGTLIAYATSPGQYALDGATRNGAYTGALLKHIDTVDCSIETMLKRVRNTLSAATKGRQISWEHTSLAGEFYFNRSVGARIDLYGETALKDQFFSLVDTRASHKVIVGLKSHDWYTQNPALSSFTRVQIARASLDSLFVVGRNVYQAACGSSRAASSFIRNFPALASELKEAKWRALLDGMLFEVFFDPKGELRGSAKLASFEELFALQQYQSLAESFTFIAEALLPYSHLFPLLPGRNQTAALDVITTTSGEDYLVNEIRLGGSNLLQVATDEDEDLDLSDVKRRTISRERFEQQLSQQLVTPARLLKVSYVSLDELPEDVHVPWGWSLRATTYPGLGR